MATTRGRKYIFNKQKKASFSLSELCCGARALSYWQLLKLKLREDSKIVCTQCMTLFSLFRKYVIRLDIIVKSKSGGL